MRPWPITTICSALSVEDHSVKREYQLRRTLAKEKERYYAGILNQAYKRAVDIDEVQRNIANIEAELAEVQAQMKKYLEELGL